MMEGLKPYPAYKESAVSWLGRVPEHWRVIPARAIYRPKLEKNVGMLEKVVLSLSYGRIVVKPKEKLRGLVPESFETYQIVNPGDVIVRSTDLQNDKNSQRVGLSRNRGIITSAYICLAPTGCTTSEYGYFLLNVYDLSKIIYGYGSGLRQNLSFADIRQMPVPVPPLDEQRSIVRFLDDADRRIRRYIRAKRRLIALLNEQKQVVIHRAVTRGLDPSVHFKPSAIEALGEIPGQWEIVLTQRIFKEVIRPHGGLPETQLSLSQRDGLIATSAMQERSLQTSTFDNWKITIPGDLVLNRFKAHLGVFFASHMRGIVSFHYGVFSPRRPLVAKYFELLYHTVPFKAIFAGRSNGMTVGLQNLSNQNFYNVRTVVPPIWEQELIVSFASDAGAKFEKLTRSALDEIRLMQEYRNRLIADIVTGKLDVREAAAALSEGSSEGEIAEPDDIEDSDEIESENEDLRGSR